MTSPKIIFNNPKHPAGKIYKKTCRACKQQRSFYAGTMRDKQSVCGNCWVW